MDQDRDLYDAILDAMVKIDDMKRFADIDQRVVLPARYGISYFKVTITPITQKEYDNYDGV